MARDWKLPDELGDRANIPYVKDTNMDLSEFKLFIQEIKCLDPSTAESHAMRVSYFFGMFEVTPPTCSGAAFMSKFYSSKIAQQWLKLDIVSPKLPNSQNLLVAVKHYIDYLLLEAKRERDDEAARDLSLLQTEILQKGWKMLRRIRKKRETRNKHKKADRLKRLAPVPVLQAAIKQAKEAL